MARRFSLWSLLVTLTMFALGVTCVVLNWRLKRFEERLLAANARAERLEARLGFVDPGDANRVQVLNIPQPEDLHWKWRVRLPDKTPFVLKAKLGDIGDQEFSRHDAELPYTHPLTDDPVDVELWLYRERDGVWHWIVRIETTSTTSRCSDAMQAWLNEPLRGLSSEVAGNNRTEEFESQGIVPLFRSVEHANGQRLPLPRVPGVSQIQGPSPYGLRLWLHQP